MASEKVYVAMGCFAACTHGSGAFSMGFGVLGVFWCVCYAQGVRFESKKQKQKEILGGICFVDEKGVWG